MKLPSAPEKKHLDAGARVLDRYFLVETCLGGEWIPRAIHQDAEQVELIAFRWRRIYGHRATRVVEIWVSDDLPLSNAIKDSNGSISKAQIEMPTDEIVSKFRQIDALVAQGLSVNEALLQFQVSGAMYQLWRQGVQRLKSEHNKLMTELEQENADLRRSVAELTLDKLILSEVAKTRG